MPYMHVYFSGLKNIILLKHTVKYVQYYYKTLYVPLIDSLFALLQMKMAETQNSLAEMINKINNLFSPTQIQPLWESVETEATPKDSQD